METSSGVVGSMRPNTLAVALVGLNQSSYKVGGRQGSLEVRIKPAGFFHSVGATLQEGKDAASTIEEGGVASADV